MKRIYFKAFRDSPREYWVEAENSAAFFVKAALEDCRWIIVRVESLPEEN